MPDVAVSLAARLAQNRPVLIDGGLATQLEAAGNDLSGDLWSARLLAEAPEEIAAAHRTYFQAGAEVAITASYQASFAGFAALGVPRDTASTLMGRSVELARQARAQVSSDATPRWVAASIGPYGASLADGSEYRGRYGLSRAQLRDFHLPRLEVLAGAGPDLLAIETIPDCDEALVLLEAIGEFEIPAWLSFTISGASTRAGQPLDEAFALAAESEQVLAVGVNCCAPGDVAPALAILTSVTDKPAVVYPNSGERWDAAARAWRPSAAQLLDPVGWAGAGARFIGGCCRTTPADIARFAAALQGMDQDAEADASSRAGSQPR